MEVQEFPNYLIYEDGKVWSKKYNKFLIPWSTRGYHYVTLCNDEKKNKQIHRLIAEHYIPNPKNYPCINHKDKNRKNNNISNLEWCSRMYNNQSINTNKNFGYVCEDKQGRNKKFRAEVFINRKRHMKSFYTKEDAEDWLKFIKVCAENNLNLE